MMTVYIQDKHSKALKNTLDVPAWVWGGIRDLSRIQGVSPSTVMKHALSTYLARYFKHDIVCSKLEDKANTCA